MRYYYFFVTLLVCFSCTGPNESQKETKVVEATPVKPIPYKTTAQTIGNWSIPFTISSTKAPDEHLVYDEIAEELRKDTSLKIMVIGHTCDIGFGYKNKALSEKRAKAVYDKLIQLGFDENRLDWEGIGEDYPEEEDESEEARERNRRVSFRRF